MHNCPSCKKSTANLLALSDDVIKEDVCDECTLVAIIVGFGGDLEEALILSSLEEMTSTESVLL